jgi:hypothetical protein
MKKKGNVMPGLCLIDAKFILRRMLAFSLTLIPMAALSTSIILLTNRAFPGLPFYAIFILAVGLAFFLILLSLPLLSPVQVFVDRIFFQETYEYRQTLVNISLRMGNILNLDQLSMEILITVSKALNISQTRLLFKNSLSGNFVTRYKYPETAVETINDLYLPADAPMVILLQKESLPLNMRKMENIFQSKALDSQKKIGMANLEYLFPLKSHGKLVAILAVAKKQSGKSYSQEDLKLIMAAVNQAGVILENALLYQDVIKSFKEMQTGSEKIDSRDK